MNIRACILCLAALCAAGCGNNDAIIPPSADSPASTVLKFTQALENHDGPALRPLLAADTPAQKVYADALVNLADASGQMVRAAVDRFGSEQGKQVLGVGLNGQDQYLRFAEGRAEIKSDQATLTAADGQTLRLRREQNRWLLLPSAKDDADLSRQTAMLNSLTSRLQQATKDVRAGKLPDADAVRKQLAAR